MGNYNCALQTNDESLFKPASYVEIVPERHTLRVAAQPEPVKAVAVDHSPQYPVAQETLQMNRESKLAANTEGRFNPVSLKDFNEEHPVLGAYMYSDNGATYTGQYYYGNREGSGKQVYPNGGLYNGEWR
jgi:hypothetical protein